jgi:hypothetical protein
VPIRRMLVKPSKLASVTATVKLTKGGGPW